MQEDTNFGADVVVDMLKQRGVEYVFGIPGAKIDRVFDALEHPSSDDAPKLIVCRHEQNAAFMAQGIGRISGAPGVVLTTSGPGASNLATGLVTATSEGDPVLALSGQVKRSDLKKLTHQSMDNVALMKPICKYAAEVQDPNGIDEIIEHAWREARFAKRGASFVSLPQDVVDSKVTKKQRVKATKMPHLGSASAASIAYLVEQIHDAKLPILLVGMRASAEAEVAAIRRLVKQTHLPVVETFQASGVISRDLEEHFFGRVGLFRNQAGDMLLKRSDLVICVGYDPIEYEARNWNAELDAKTIVIDQIAPEIDEYLHPERELIGSISATLDLLGPALGTWVLPKEVEPYLADLRELIHVPNLVKKSSKPNCLHPLEVVDELQSFVDDTMTVTVDVGSHYIWMARYFRSYEPRKLLFSNGMQTLGVALPWAISAALLRPGTQIVSVAGDGGFLFSAQELETAVRLGLNIIQIIFSDGAYNMVEFQEEMKYGRSSGVTFGAVDYVKYAEAFGAKGKRATTKEELRRALCEAKEIEGPVIIDINVDYSDNAELGQALLADQFI